MWDNYKLLFKGGNKVLKSLKKCVPVILILTMVFSVFTGLNPAVSATDISIRNLALRRAAYQSSAYSFNETAQLVTDGIIGEVQDEEKMAYGFSHEQGNDSRYGNVKHLFDDDIHTLFETYNTTSWVQVHIPNKRVVASYTLTSCAEGNWDIPEGADPSAWTLQGSNDGTNFTTIDSRAGQNFSGRGVTNTYTISNTAASYTYYRLNITGIHGSDRIRFSEWSLLDASGNRILQPYGSDDFVSCWMSGGNTQEWVYVDLGVKSTISSAKVYWGSLFAKSYEIQVSDDAKNWTKIAQNDNGAGGVENFTFAAQARYVRLLCTSKPTTENLAYIVREFEVYGTNRLEYKGEVDKMPAPKADGTQFLAGGNWKVERASVIDANANTQADPDNANDAADIVGCNLSTQTYDYNSWLPAIVPGTVLTSYIKAGAVPDPSYADQQSLVSDSYFKSNFWYRNSFIVPDSQQGRKVWLNFEAINYKAEVYFNGHRMGNILGGFTRAKFDITPYANFGQENYVAVLVYKNTDPGTPYVTTDNGPGTMGGVFNNDGSIGADGPTMSASAGWDWVPTVRGRNIGIYNDVFLTYTQEVQVVNPWMVTTFDKNADGTMDLSKANLTLKTEVSNTKDEPVIAKITGTIDTRSDLSFSKVETIPANSTVEVDFDTVVMSDPQVWWPNTYGDQPLYTTTVTSSVNGIQSDSKSFKFGVREFDYKMDPGTDKDPNGYINGKNLALYCNGARIITRGGNWGMEDINNDVDDEKFDNKIRFHHDANLNIIRNWGGQTNDPAFYEACDKYGILIWDDFMMPGGWLHVPKDVPLFLANAEDKIKDYRSHPSLVFYCGGNELYPEKQELEDGLRNLTKTLDGTRLYFPNSRQDPVGPGGPYAEQGPKFYFKSTTPNLITSERGLPNIPVLESMKAMLPEDKQWPKNPMWALHDMCDGWNVNGKQYMQDAALYGNYSNLEQFVKNAQMVGYENFKAIFEATFDNRANGMLLWMSQPAWPSMIWQTYDYYQDVNGGYFGVKAGSQPINFIWNIANNNMVLYNETAKDEPGLKAIVELYDINGKLLYAKSETKDMKADSRETLFPLSFAQNATDIQFIRTKVENVDGKVIAEDFYWNNINTYEDYAKMAEIPKANISAQYAYVDTKDSSRYYRIRVENNTDKPAIMMRLKVMNSQTGERVLPVFYEDNYFSLMPGEVKEIKLDFKEKDLNGAEPQFEIEGWNVDHAVISQDKKSYYVGNIQMKNNDTVTGSVSAGNFTGSVDVVAEQDTNAKFTLMVAVYKDRKLVDISRKPVDINLKTGEKVKVETTPVTIPDGEDATKYTIKSFLWDGANLLKPMKSYLSLSSFTPAPASYLKRNIAVGSTITASTTEQGSNVAQCAIDGSMSTRWASVQGNDNEWLLVDLGKVSTFNAVSINWESAYGKAYRIEVSEDGKNYTQIVHKTDGTGGSGTEKEDKFDFSTPISARYVRWVGEQRGTGWGYSIYEFSILTNSEPSLAADAIVTASDFDETDHMPSNIVDGEMSTRWAAKAATDDHWVLLDLQKQKTFSSVELTWESAYAEEYKIQISNDGTNFTDLVNETNGKPGTLVYKFTPATARYVKVKMIKRGTGWTYSIYEMGLY